MRGGLHFKKQKIALLWLCFLQILLSSFFISCMSFQTIPLKIPCWESATFEREHTQRKWLWPLPPLAGLLPAHARRFPLWLCVWFTRVRNSEKEKFCVKHGTGYIWHQALHKENLICEVRFGKDWWTRLEVTAFHLSVEGSFSVYNMRSRMTFHKNTKRIFLLRCEKMHRHLSVYLAFS